MAVSDAARFSCFLFRVHRLSLDLYLTANILCRKLVHIGTYLRDLVGAITPHPVPFTLDSQRDSIAVFGVSIEDTFKIMGG